MEERVLRTEKSCCDAKVVKLWMSMMDQKRCPRRLAVGGVMDGLGSEPMLCVFACCRWESLEDEGRAKEELGFVLGWGGAGDEVEDLER